MSVYRQSPFANLTPVVKNLLIINVICFLIFLLFDHSRPGGPVNSTFGVYYFNSPNFRVWQIITYMFMHGSFGHIFFNMFALFSFGPIVENTIGSKKFLNLYFICGIGAIFFQMLVQAVEIYQITSAITIAHPALESSYYQYGDQAQKLYDIYHASLVGASGAIYGILIVFRMLYPELELMIMFIPIPIKAKYLVPVFILIEIFLGFKQFSGDNIAHFAHLGGALLGFIMVKVWRLQGPRKFY